MVSPLRSAFVAFAAAAGVLASAQLYGLSSSRPGTLYTIDSATGAAAAVVDLAGVDLANLNDIEFLGGTLYASNVFVGNSAFFGTIDLATGAFTALNDQNGNRNSQSLAADQGAGLLYTIALGFSGGDLRSVAPTGAITTIGVTSPSISGLAFDDEAKILYGVDGNDLYTISTANGAATLVGSLGIATGGLGDIAYDEAANVLYLNTGDTGAGENSLYTVNVSTGLATRVGTNGATNGIGIDGLAFRPVPEPAPVAALALGALAFLRRRR